MKKTIKRILFGTGIVVIAIVLLFVGYGVKAKSIMKQMAPAETGEIVDDVISIHDSFANVFLVKDGETYIAVDAGNDPENVLKELARLGINPDQINAVLLTHTDADHVAAISLFKNAKVYLSTPEEQLLNGKKSRFLFFGNSIATKDYALINDGQTFNIGNIKINGILTPGHTAGSMCFLINGKYLFTGDAISLKGGKINQLDKFFNVDSKMAAQSIDLITNLPTAEYIFTAHYGYTNNYKDAVKNWIKQ